MAARSSAIMTVVPVHVGAGAKLPLAGDALFVAKAPVRGASFYQGVPVLRLGTESDRFVGVVHFNQPEQIVAERQIALVNVLVAGPAPLPRSANVISGDAVTVNGRFIGVVTGDCRAQICSLAPNWTA